MRSQAVEVADFMILHQTAETQRVRKMEAGAEEARHMPESRGRVEEKQAMSGWINTEQGQHGVTSLWAFTDVRCVFFLLPGGKPQPPLSIASSCNEAV